MTLNVHAERSRPALVLAPGMLSDEAVWAPLAADLAGDADLIFAHYGAAAGLEAMALAVLAQAPERFALAGHSMGGRIALEVARLAPERVTRLALLSADHLPKPGGERGEAETRARQALLQTGRSQGMAAVADRFLPVLLPSDRLDDEALAGPIRAMIARQDPDAFARQIALGEQRVSQADVLAGLAVPLLLICGARDGFGRAPIQAQMAALAAGARVFIVEACGHMVTLEAPRTVNMAIRDWLFAQD